MKPSDFSLLVCPWGDQPQTPQDIVDVATHAEELGFHSIALAHVPVLPDKEERPPSGLVTNQRYRQYQYDPLVVVPLMARATRTIRVGFNAVVTPYLHPFVWAKYLASLDAASDGRALAGFGLGYAPPKGVAQSLRKVGIDSHQRGRMSDEALELITKLWTSDSEIDFEGRYYKAIQLLVDPKPVRKPYPELWWAGDAAPSVERAARYADYLEMCWQPAHAIRDRWAPALREANAKWGARAKLADLIFVDMLPRDLSREEINQRYHTGYLEDAFAVGTPETVAVTIRKLRDAGVEHFAVDLHRHGWDHVNVHHKQMESFVKELLPLLS